MSVFCRLKTLLCRLNYSMTLNTTSCMIDQSTCFLLDLMFTTSEGIAASMICWLRRPGLVCSQPFPRESFPRRVGLCWEDYLPKQKVILFCFPGVVPCSNT